MANYVPPIGPRDAKIVLVGEAPGAEEDLRREPFVGASGKLLTSMLSSIGVSRNEVYLTNIVKVRPPNNQFSFFYEDGDKRCRPGEFLQKSIADLNTEIKAISPNIIVALGDEPLRALTGRRGIGKWRGTVHHVAGLGKVLGTYHPAYTLRLYESRTVVELDLRKAVKESKTKAFAVNTRTYDINPSFKQVIDFLEEVLKSHHKLSLDIETLGSNVRCLGLSTRIDHAICIPFIKFQSMPTPGSTTLVLYEPGTSDVPGNYWSETEELAILQKLDEVFSNPLIPKTAQNAPFDLTVLAWDFGFDIVNLSLDTMVAAHTAYPELPKGLDFLTSIYTNRPYYSDYDASVDNPTWIYNCDDVSATLEISDVLEKELRELGLWEFYVFHIHPALTAFARAQSKGVRIDQVERTRQAGVLQEEIAALTTKIRAVVGEPDFNPASPKQLADYLYRKLGLPVQRHHKTKQETTNKDAMESLARKFPRQKEFFDACREHSSRETVLSGFHSKPLGPDGRIYTSYNLAGTVTGRLSSSEHFLLPASTNLQNIQKPPARTRACFISDEGWSFIKVDLSQAEFRLVVWFAKIERLIKTYADNPDFDVHRWVASLIFKKPEADIVKTERDIAKNGVYGGNYKMHYVTASRTYKIPLDQAKWVLEEYRKAIPEIPLWWTTVELELNRTRTLVNPFGRKRIFLGRMDDDLYRAAYAHLPQSTVADIINRAAALATEIFSEDSCFICLQVHDELVFLCRDELVMEFIPKIRRLMEPTIWFDGIDTPLVIPADLAVGKNWMDCKKIESKVLV